MFFRKKYLIFVVKYNDMEKQINLDQPLWQLTVGEFLDLLSTIHCQSKESEQKPNKRLVYGIGGIAQLFNCSTTTANRIKASGKIDRAISQSGRMIVVDADLALELMKKDNIT